MVTIYKKHKKNQYQIRRGTPKTPRLKYEQNRLNEFNSNTQKTTIIYSHKIK